MKSVVILTGSELRHSFYRKAISLSNGINVLRSYCEGLEKSLPQLTAETDGDKDLRTAHLNSRLRSEEDFFGAFVEFAPDSADSVFLPKGEINNPKYFDDIRAMDPDLLVAYGCSIIRDPILSAFKGRILNVHLGLSPYYRGSGTNFWPLVNGTPEYVGVTFMYMDAGVDTGEIIHQIRPRIFPDDGPHDIGNRLIADMTRCYVQIIKRFDSLIPAGQLPVPKAEKYCRRKDFSEQSVRQLREQFESGMVERFLRERDTRLDAVPIIENPALADTNET